MIFLDGIIYKLQKFGGISTYFNELNNGLLLRNFPFKLLNYVSNNNLDLNVITKYPRLLERYLPVSNIPNNSILHSSYYRYSLQKNVKNVIHL